MIKQAIKDNQKAASMLRDLLARLEQQSEQQTSALALALTGATVLSGNVNTAINIGPLTKEKKNTLEHAKNQYLRTLNGNSLEWCLAYRLAIIQTKEGTAPTVFVVSSLSPTAFAAEIKTALCAIEQMDEYYRKIDGGQKGVFLSCIYCEKECEIQKFCKNWGRKTA